jgi:hypothetical protein
MNEIDKSNPQVTGNIGMYYACYRLSQMGLNVMPTARNARGIDIIAYNKSGSKYLGLQVKSLSKKSPVPVGDSLEKVMGHFWIIITEVKLEHPKVYIMTPDEVKLNALKGEGKNGKIAFWLRPTAYEHFEVKQDWKRIEDEFLRVCM